MNTSAPALIDALNGTFGRHAGARASHAKGNGVLGTFVASDAAHGLKIGGLDKANVVGRFSVGGGNPNQPDTSRTVRGLGLQISGQQESWSLVLISNPVFFARDARQFVEFLAARKPDPTIKGPNPEAVAAFNAANPNTVPHQAYLKNTAPTACYTREHYYSGHAYGLADGRWARMEARPIEGRLGISPDEEKSLDAKFLFTRLEQRLTSGPPAQWDLIARIAAPGELIEDVTAPWEEKGEEIILGRISINAVDSDESRLAAVYDPSNIPSGITEPRDPIFPLRSAAYSESFARRSN